MSKSRKQKDSNVGEIGPKCSQATADAIACSDDSEFLPPYGCPYPAGSGSKVEWLKNRQQRFGSHLVSISIKATTAERAIAKRRRTSDNVRLTTDEMDAILWNPADNPLTVPRPETINGQTHTVRQIITTLHAQE